MDNAVVQKPETIYDEEADVLRLQFEENPASGRSRSLRVSFWTTMRKAASWRLRSMARAYSCATSGTGLGRGNYIHSISPGGVCAAPTSCALFALRLGYGEFDEKI